MANSWVALLRGINVGGRNRVAMADLRDALTDSGLLDVRSYIQSGNVTFDVVDPTADQRSIATAIAATVDRAVGLSVPVIVRRLDDIDRIRRSHPDAGGAVPPKWLHVYLLDAVVSAEATPEPSRFAPDRMHVDGCEVYATYPKGSGRSKLTLGLIERTFGVTATARNVATLDAIFSLGSSES